MGYDAKFLITWELFHRFPDSICHIPGLVSYYVGGKSARLLLKIKAIHLSAIIHFVLLLVQVVSVIEYRVAQGRQLYETTHVARYEEENNILLILSSSAILIHESILILLGAFHH